MASPTTIPAASRKVTSFKKESTGFYSVEGEILDVEQVEKQKMVKVVFKQRTPKLMYLTHNHPSFSDYNLNLPTSYFIPYNHLRNMDDIKAFEKYLYALDEGKDVADKSIQDKEITSIKVPETWCIRMDPLVDGIRGCYEFNIPFTSFWFNLTDPTQVGGATALYVGMVLLIVSSVIGSFFMIRNQK